MNIVFALYAQNWVVVTTLNVLAHNAAKWVATIILTVSVQYVTEQEESTIRTAFVPNVAEWGNHSIQRRYPYHLLARKLTRWSIL